MTSKPIKLTKKALADAPLGAGWIRIDDHQVNGLKLYSGKTRKTIYLRRTIHRQGRDFKLCTWESWVSPEQVRKLAIREAAMIAEGIDPSAKTKADEAKKVTLIDAFNLLVSTRTTGVKPIKPSTAEQWQYCWKTDLSPWANRKLVSITADQVEQLHKERTKTSPSRANYAVRLLGQIFKIARVVYVDEAGQQIITTDPTQRIRVLKRQNKIEARTGHIPEGKLEDWFKSAQSLDNEATCDLLVFTLMTGLRKNEAAQLTWDRVDMDAGTYTIVENKADRPVTLPLSDYLIDMVERRKAIAGVRRYVFPAGQKSGYLKDWRASCRMVTAKCGVAFRPHDLRRSFVTYAESLNTPHLVIKQLVNHALPKGDVTAGYVQMQVERMREPMQKITDHILRNAGLTPSNVMSLHDRKRRQGYA